MPFVKGQSGNPAGRKPSAVRLELDVLLNRAWPANRREQSLINLVTMADEGNIEAIKLLMAYAYGRPIERKEITGADGEAIQVRFFNYNAAITALTEGSEGDPETSEQD